MFREANLAGTLLPEEVNHDVNTNTLVELRKRNPKTRFVFVSGYAEEAFKKNLPEGESLHFLPKPFTMKQLVETVKAAMAVITHGM